MAHPLPPSSLPATSAPLPPCQHCSMPITPIPPQQRHCAGVLLPLPRQLHGTPATAVDALPPGHCNPPSLPRLNHLNNTTLTMLWHTRCRSPTAISASTPPTPPTIKHTHAPTSSLSAIPTREPTRTQTENTTNAPIQHLHQQSQLDEPLHHQQHS